MARRAGKAASRKARQRNVPRQPKAAPPPAAAETPVSPEVPEPAVPEEAPAVARSAPAAVISPRPRRAAVVAASASRGSTLTDRERADYHYVERDLRNIGILTVIMLALLVLAWLVFRATGLIG